MQRTLIYNGQVWQLPGEGAGGAPTVRWVDMETPGEEEFQRLEQEFRFHALAIEDCRHLDQRSKLEEYHDHLFVVLHSHVPTDHDPTDLHLQELHIFLREGLIVTVHDERMEAVDHVWARLMRNSGHIGRTPAGVLHHLADAVVDGMFAPVERLNDLIDQVAENVLDNPDAQLLARTMAIKRAILDIRRLNGPAREVLAALARAELPGISEHEALYFRDVLDHLQMLQQQMDVCRELVADTRDVYLSAQGNRVNQIVKRLTVMATLGLPLTFITGFFGMNFTHMPFDSQTLMYSALLGMVTLPVAMLGFFRWRHWI